MLLGRWQKILQVGVLAPLLCAACSSPRNRDILDFLQAHEHDVSAIEYRLGIPDAIAISAPRILEIDGESLGIQPDGKIHLRLLGDVKIVGMTPKEVAGKLEVLLKKYYVDPKISVRVAVYASKKFYIVREDGQTGSLPYTGRDTVMDVVALAGTSFLSWTKNVKIIRPHHTEEGRKIIRVDVDKMLRTGDVSANLLIEPNDIVVIPPTPVAWVGFRIRELLWPIGPAFQAYAAPATVIAASKIYDGENNGIGINGIGISGSSIATSSIR